MSFSEAPPLANAFDSLAEFSSKGPTKDGRVKPDLLAPGTLQSAYTDGDNTCSLRCDAPCCCHQGAVIYKNSCMRALKWEPRGRGELREF